MNKYASELVMRLHYSNVKVVTRSVCWKPIRISHRSDASAGLTSPSVSIIRQLENAPPEDIIVVGNAVNQYFFQSKLAQTNTAVIWSCFDVVAKELCCIKAYYVESFTKERAIRCNRGEVEVISLMDKVIDEALYHASVTFHPGVCTLREIVVDLKNSVFYLVMDHYPGQILHYDEQNKVYTGISPGNMIRPDTDSCSLQLFNENDAKIIIQDISLTLKYLHANGIIHKDLKPENILLTGSIPLAHEAVIMPFIQEVNISTDYPADIELYSTFYGEELLEHVKEFIMSHNSVSYEDAPVCGVVPRHFPYSPALENEMDFNLADQCPIICDIIKDSDDHSTVRIGSSALNYARRLKEENEASSIPILDFFLSQDGPSIRYHRHEAIQEAAASFYKLKGEKPELSTSMAHHEMVRQPSVVLTDFGVASIAESGDGIADPLIFDGEGTTSFTSPEALKDLECGISGSKRDIFSLGAILFTMIFGKLPYEGNSGIVLLVNMLHKPLQFPNYRQVSDELKELLRGMLNTDPRQRFDIDQVVSHPWFSVV
ncbi:protein kinase domain containing protein [Babesia bovis T2Bo]|uniref:Protein kinase domain containing protein n=1 Tax=Babesia bovis TaxID=5865 RepID=A7AW12_BABBO|nr:protein kinase domain containing protein [Babesia bovis T2Bo]EDO05240.1 protein kinase domain containing protein [Babesia bovis T2Bo]|eukprot:XP_001608808.1 protein kinase domain containing protein [Babesia bovis T2Bo]